MKPEDERFLKLAPQALNLTKHRCKYPRTFFDDDEVINMCYAYGYWRKYVTAAQNTFIWIISHSMIILLNKQIFGRENKRWMGRCRPDIEKNMTIRTLIDEDIAIQSREPDPYYYASQLDTVENIFGLVIPKYRYESVLYFLGGYSCQQIGRKLNCAGETVRLHVREQREILIRKSAASPAKQDADSPANRFIYESAGGKELK